MIKWVFKNQQKNIKIKYLKKILNINSKLSILLLQRKINSYKKAKDFFCPNIKKLYNPFLMKDMNIAVKYILFFIKKKKKILLYGDYDVDGITSVSMFYLFIKKELKYDNIYYYIPNRKNEGYGLSYKGIDFAKSINISLIITLDCGSKDKLKIDYAKKKGIKIIICDHHIIEKNINNSIAFLNPKRLDCKYPFKYLSGCGVTFKYIHGISKILKIEKKIYKYLHFVTISIASDVVPLINENRIISFYGLKNINENYNNKIFDLLNKKKYISISDIIFQISPKLNSTGRIENAKISVDFFIKKKNKNILNKINKINIKRKKINEKILKESIYFINKYEKNKSKIIILFKKDWEIGVLGIVASKIVEIYYKPTIIFTNNNNDKNLFIASGRSIKEFNIYKEVKKCSNFLHSFGGHNYAIGLTLKKKNFIIFKKKN
ncbi:single-stranded-DNA-specific exonuclease RecJ [Candidatus Shikimatogenerans silvanidophilus]|uniref:single-stranded-DNA-specific exonuclease RecJ n=1 Tax=Candidatus Shikimatogenerans silvanidophilus TaxID=2782547 RepID=UPI001BAD271D|nr:DHH family phosphoesterase [Candidatus Shikimatogenerans silvanidophilus]